MSKKEFRKKLTEYVASRKNLDDFCEEQYEICGEKVYVNINIDGDNVFNELSNVELGDNIISFIDKETYYIPVDYQIVLRFKGNFTEEQKAQVKKNLARHYELEFNDKNLDVKLNRFRAWGLFGLGALFLGLSFVVAKFYTGKILTEFMSIAATFMLWESVDFWLIECNKSKVKKVNTAQILLAETEFED